MTLAVTLPLACAALAGEAAFGYPDALFRLLGHPVTWMGRLIAGLDRGLNREHAPPRWRRAAGVLALAILLTFAAAIASAITIALGSSLIGFVILALLAASLPAQRSLDRHVAAVARALDREGVAGGRAAVAMIVGRDTAALDEAAVARAAIESLAENFADGIVAPALWLALGGLPGGVLYKAANTADSMIGHRTPRHEAFGWAAARFDDLVNLPASRLAALWLVLACLITRDRAGDAARAVLRDARRHRSPNAGWPEAAMAGALGLQLGGPRFYGRVQVDDGFMGEGRPAATTADISRGLRLYRTACLLQWIVVLALALTVQS